MYIVDSAFYFDTKEIFFDKLCTTNLKTYAIA